MGLIDFSSVGVNVGAHALPFQFGERFQAVLGAGIGYADVSDVDGEFQCNGRRIAAPSSSPPRGSRKSNSVSSM